MSAKIEFHNITKVFPGVKALDGVSFAVETGEVHGLVGENGAGKSTLIKIISGALNAESGEMLLDGKVFHPAGPQDSIIAGISSIYQERSFLPERNVMFNIMLGREKGSSLGRLDFGEMKKKCREVLKLLHSENIGLDLKAGDLKAGQKQILEIGRALVQKSSVLIMDEPTSALNLEERESLFQGIKRLQAEGMTIIYVSHRLEEIFRLADRVTVLRDGKWIQTSRINEINKDDLIKAMVGREWTGSFPSKNAEPGKPVLEVEGLSGKSFRNISFQLRQGEVIGITGLAGSGKEELGQALFGAYPIIGGRIKIAGEEISPTPWTAIKAGIAYLPEDRKTEGIIQSLSVRRNISLPILGKLSGLIGNIRIKQERELAQSWVDQLGIKTPGLEQVCENLSGGNQQKVVLAKWLASRARLIILACPTQEVDVVVKFELYRLISELSRKGIAIILISSDLPEIVGVSRRVLVMRNGEIAAELESGRVESETILRYALGQAAMGGA